MIEIVDTRTGELMDTDSVPGLAQVAGLHDELIYQLLEVVERLEGGSADAGGAGNGPFVWDRLDEHAARKAWRELAEWVCWLRGRYPLARQVPLCWWRHPELVEELTALWLAWKDAYLDKKAPLTAPADWHGRWLPEFLRRVGTGGWNVACEGDHKDRLAGLYDHRGVDDQDEFDAFIDAPAGVRRPIAVEEPDKKEKVMDDKRMKAALAGGEARAIGTLDDSPVHLDDTYWVATEEGWTPVQDPDTIAYLSDADRRMRLADEAVARSKQS